MRNGIATLVILALAASSLLAGEVLPVLQAEGQTYSNVTVLAVSATDIFFIAPWGVVTAKLRYLDPALQKRYRFDPVKAAAIDSRYHFRVGSVTNEPVSAADVKAELDDARARVEQIVNQPVTALPRTPDMEPDIFTYPYWFHPGAEKPDFNNVDVRISQELSYASQKYVVSELNPNAVYLGSELEFNAMTKYFYTDRTVPKKKLTGLEMLDINRLYRIIGQDREHLARLQIPVD
jgi:hypothetical protein